jgi:hypothetical protein
MFLECFFDVFPMFFLSFLREKIQKTHEKTLEKHWKNITIFLFFYSLCVFNVFFKKSIFFQCFSNVLFFENIGKTLEK